MGVNRLSPFTGLSVRSNRTAGRGEEGETDRCSLTLWLRGFWSMKGYIAVLTLLNPRVMEKLRIFLEGKERRMRRLPITQFPEHDEKG